MESSPKGETSPLNTPQSITNSYRPISTRRVEMQNGSIRTPVRQGQGSLGLSALSFSESQTSLQDNQPQQYGDEMDWSPSGSQHRAFSTHEPFRVRNPNPRFSNNPLGFNDTPIEPKPGPFWYKVPPAPSNPAQRLRNPVQPVIRESPKEKQESFFSRSREALNLGTRAQGSDSSFVLKDPQFYAPAPRDDPRDGLSSMMGSFSISPDPEDRRAATRIGPNANIFANNGASATAQNNKIRMAELLVLFGALWAWVTAVNTEDAYGPTLGLGAICACLIVSLRLTADMLVDAQIKTGKHPSILSLSWANLGYVQVIAALVLVCNIWGGSAQHISCGVYGNALLGVMITHQFWHVFS